MPGSVAQFLVLLVTTAGFSWQSHQVPQSGIWTDKEFLKAEQGDSAARLSLCSVYLVLDDLALDQQVQILSWCRHLAEKGHPEAMEAWGHAYRQGRGVEKNAAMAIQWFRKAAEKGDADVMLWLGEMYLNGEGVLPDLDEAYRWWRAMVDQGSDGNPGLQVHMTAMRLLEAKNYEQALKWLRLSTDIGFEESAEVLGAMYYGGRWGVAQDYRTALIWLSKAKDYAYARYLLADAFFHGNGIDQDYKEALKRFKSLAESQKDLEEHYKSQKAFYRELEQGGTTMPAGMESPSRCLACILAQVRLGEMYEKGLGVPHDYSAAVPWYRLAAEQGQSLGQLRLAFLYSFGEGVAQDYVQAHMWSNLAGASGNEQVARDARKLRDMLAEEMTAGQVAEAQRLAREWKPKSPH